MAAAAESTGPVAFPGPPQALPGQDPARQDISEERRRVVQADEVPVCVGAELDGRLDRSDVCWAQGECKQEASESEACNGLEATRSHGQAFVLSRPPEQV